MPDKPDRIAIASRDVGVRKPLSPSWHAELHAPFELHAVYREHSDGTRQTYGSLSVEAVEVWQKAAKHKGRVGELEAALDVARHEIEGLRKRVTVLKDALEPFAAESAVWRNCDHHEHVPLLYDRNQRSRVNIRHFRRASHAAAGGST